MGLPRLICALAVAVVSLALAPCRASAEDRPPEGGLWSFDPTDVLDHWEEPSGRVRVHFSVEGPNVTRLDDLDDDGAPDFAQDVARVTLESIELYESLGFRAPVPESAIEQELGGSPAYDVYLVDFGGAADGRFGTDGCGKDGCAGFMVIENDFAGYGYPTLEDAVATVASHESFHAVQAAYNVLPIWVSEGTATWAERQYEEESADFVRLCNGLLADPGRPVYEPPGGPVPLFAYGTALWFDFLTERHDAGLVVDFLDALIEDKAAAAPELSFESLLAARDDDLGEAWTTFARYNLGTGRRAGASASHPYAGQLDGIEADFVGGPLALDARFYPLAANYYNVLHPGGDAWFVNDAPLPDVSFSLHPVADFRDDGAVGDAIATWDADVASEQLIYRDLPAGGYWVVGARRVVADGPARANVCVASDEDRAEACPSVDEGTTGGGATSSGGDGAQESSTAGDNPPQGDTSGGFDTATGSSSGPVGSGGEGSGCSCTHGGRPDLPLVAGLWLAMLAVRRRRR